MNAYWSGLLFAQHFQSLFATHPALVLMSGGNPHRNVKVVLTAPPEDELSDISPGLIRRLELYEVFRITLTGFFPLG
jgi:hypothetical protein